MGTRFPQLWLQSTVEHSRQDLYVATCELTISPVSAVSKYHLEYINDLRREQGKGPGCGKPFLVRIAQKSMVSPHEPYGDPQQLKPSRHGLDPVLKLGFALCDCPNTELPILVSPWLNLRQAIFSIRQRVQFMRARLNSKRSWDDSSTAFADPCKSVHGWDRQGTASRFQQRDVPREQRLYALCLAAYTGRQERPRATLSIIHVMVGQKL